jgi:hypothetical protein
MKIKLTRGLFALALFAFAACNSNSAQTRKLTAADLQKLRWIEGTWRGTGDNVKPFFERYRFEGDSSLLIDGFEDETLAKVTDTTRYELKDGEFGGGNDGHRYVAISLDDRAIEFGPAVNVKNGFRWERGESKDIWKATIVLPASGDKPARQRVYKMERWPKP